MKKHPLLWFYILAFGISWLGWLPFVASSQGIFSCNNPLFNIFLILPAIGPALAAFLVIKFGEKGNPNSLFKSLFKWRIGAIWLSLAVLTPLLLLIVGKILTEYLGFTHVLEWQNEDRIAALITAFIIALIANPWEEVGWRGFALPRFQQKHNALKSTLIVGALWGLWHLPLFLWRDNPMSNLPFLIWFIGVIAEAFIYTWIYNSTKGSLFAVALYHILGNTFGALIPGVSIYATVLTTCFAALLIIIIYGKENLAHTGKVSA